MESQGASKKKKNYNIVKMLTEAEVIELKINAATHNDQPTSVEVTVC